MLLSFLALLALAAPARAADYKTTDACATVEAKGRWVFDESGEAVRRFGTKGLQTSGLAWDAEAGVLWSVGDQSSASGREHLGRLYRIDPKKGGAKWVPLRAISFEEETDIGVELLNYLRANDAARFDLEAVALLPAEGGAGEFLFVSDNSGPSLLRARLAPDGKLRIADFRRLRARLRPFKGDKNRRLEGVAVDPAGGRLYAAFEQGRGGTGFLLAYPWPAVGAPEPRARSEIPVVEFLWRKRVHDDAWGDPANLSDLAIEGSGEGATLWAVSGFSGRLLRLTAEGDPTGCWKLDLRDPDGRRYAYATPEGLAIDPAGRRMWIVTDPSATRYRPLSAGFDPQSPYASLAPMLYEIAFPPPEPAEGAPKPKPSAAPEPRETDEDEP